MGTWEYDAFGNVFEQKELIENYILYRGQQYDQEAGQYYLRARYYNPVIGRFTQEDTYRGDGLNLYAYCGNNPIMHYDPSGHDQVTQPAMEPENPRTSGDGGIPTIKSQIQGLKSKTLQQLLDNGWKDVTDPRMAANTTSRDLYNPETGLRIRFD